VRVQKPILQIKANSVSGIKDRAVGKANSNPTRSQFSGIFPVVHPSTHALTRVAQDEGDLVDGAKKVASS
jgi:hypothetical protein